MQYIKKSLSNMIKIEPAKENIKQVEDNSIFYNQGKILEKTETQTDVNNAEFIIKEGVPYLDIQNVGVVFHPAWTGLYALQYANSESYYPKEVEPNEKLFFHLIKVLEDNLTYLEKDSAVWLYNFDNTYNNVYIKAPWYSSFAQAIGIEVFITAYEKTKDKKYLELAKKVANPLITPIQNNGLLFAKDGDIWFEEIPLKEKPTHILNAQLRSLIALDMLYKNSEEKIYKEYFDKGLKTLQKWLPKYDAGYWLKYDLNPSYTQLFRITNPYGFETAELAIDSISILDKNQNVLLKEDIGDGDDFDANKPIYLSGIDWKSEYKDGNLTLREIKTSLPVDFKTEFESQNLVGPYTFLNINFPTTKEKEYFIKIDYKDKPILSYINIDDLFNPSDYLVSPFNSPEKFMAEGYFLTVQQEQIYNEIRTKLSDATTKFIALTGSAGTGKTLLTYHIAKESIRKGEKVLILHCAPLNSGHKILMEEYGWSIHMPKYAPNTTDFDLIIIDEAQRMYPYQFDKYIEEVRTFNKKCIFSYDENQYLRDNEKNYHTKERIEKELSCTPYKLTDKIRTNKEIAYFIRQLFNLKKNISNIDYPNIELTYCKNYFSAKSLLQELSKKNWKVPNYTPGTRSTFHYEAYLSGDTECAHSVVGQEFDNVVIVIDDSFKYNSQGDLIADNTYYSQRQMLYQIITRTRKKLHIVIIDNEVMLDRCIDILNK